MGLSCHKTIKLDHALLHVFTMRISLQQNFVEN